MIQVGEVVQIPGENASQNAVALLLHSVLHAEALGVGERHVQDLAPQNLLGYVQHAGLVLDVNIQNQFLRVVSNRLLGPHHLAQALALVHLQVAQEGLQRAPCNVVNEFYNNINIIYILCLKLELYLNYFFVNI